MRSGSGPSRWRCPTRTAIRSRVGHPVDGAGSASASMRKRLAMGGASAVQVVDDELVGTDLGLTVAG